MSHFSHTITRLLLPFCLMCASATGCGDFPPDERAAWLRDVLIAENQAFLERAPELVEQKFALMASEPYRFMRGTAGIFWRDLQRPSPLYAIEWLQIEAEAAGVLLVGDPHPENVGTFRTEDGRLVLAFNDFDACTWGPFTGDLQRLILAWQLAWLQAAPDTAGAYVADLVIVILDAYTARMSERANDSSNRVYDAEYVDGAIALDLFERAARDGDAQEALNEYAPRVGESRSLVRGDIEERATLWFEDTLVDVTPLERRMVEFLLRTTEKSLETGAVLDVVRRLGAGVASYPVLRYYALVDGPTTSPEDDVLLELKETLNPVPAVSPVRLPAQPIPSNAGRAIWAQNSLYPGMTLDEWATSSIAGPMSFRVRERTSYQKGFDVARLASRLQSGRWTQEDVFQFAATTAEMLADAHANSPHPTAAPGAVASAIVRSLDDPGSRLKLLGWVAAARGQLLEDARRFVEMREQFGNDLGYRSSQTRNR
jgi:uncharacterized protein (DUF2252 family)